MARIDERLKERGTELLTAPVPVANCLGAARTGNLLFLVGHTA